VSGLIPQRTDEVVLYLDEDQRELERLERDLTTAATTSATSGSPRRIGDDPSVVKAAESYDAYKIQAAERGVTVRLRAMPGRKWRAAVAEHPPRNDHEADAEWGFNHLALADVVVEPCIVSIGGRELAGTELTDAVDSMSDGDFSLVYARVLRLNTGQGPDPKDSISQRLPRSSSETSESAERLA
jgi:hypothetical protein